MLISTTLGANGLVRSRIILVGKSGLRLNPKDYKLLLRETSCNILRDKISMLGGILYSKKATEAKAETIVEGATAMFIGLMLRVIFPAVVRYDKSLLDIHYT